jgi:hypothetical protein
LSDKDINYQIWNFNVLTIPEIKEQATQDAAEADLIIVSTNREEPFEPHVRQWFNQWVEAKSSDRKGAVLALLNFSPTKANPQHAYLQEMAQRAAFQYFHQSINQVPHEQH